MSLKIFKDQIRIKMYLGTLEKEMSSRVSILNNLLESGDHSSPLSSIII